MYAFRPIPLRTDQLGEQQISSNDLPRAGIIHWLKK